MTLSEMAGMEMHDSILNTYKKYGLAATHLALLSLIDEVHTLDEENNSR